MGYRIGVDVGGSFTDFAVLDEATGQYSALKVFSRPDAPGEEIAAALDILRERDGVSPAAINTFTHGTTVGVNAVIQRSGDDIALLTTQNFEDVLQIARLKIPQIHNLYSTRPEPLIPRDRIFGIRERMSATGEVLVAPDAAQVASAVRMAREAGCRGIVLSFLHAYRNPAHERTVKAMIAAVDPDMIVSCSSAIWPVIREYERTITAVISGYVQPKVSHYLDRFEAVLHDKGVACPLLITKSNGGVMGLDQARAECVQMILSGTASGVIGAGFLAQAAGFPRVLTLDLGGTSADVSVILDGAPQYGVGETIGDFQIHVPSVSVSSVGQGGGSIAWVDGLGVLHVGPQSAGSTPGPACYGRGGTSPTLTDALAVCNLLGHKPLGFGAVHPDMAAARAALGPLAAALGCDEATVAGHVIAISVSEMYAEISGLISRFGIDPRTFHLFAFGGAGAMMAGFLARELEMEGVVVPPRPGVVSALGGLIADLRNDFIRTPYCEVTEAGIASLAGTLEEMETEARIWLHETQGFTCRGHLKVAADMRFRGQSYEIETVLERDWIIRADAASVAAAFRVEHARIFGHASKEAAVQLVNLRLTIAGATPKPSLASVPAARGPATPWKVVEAWFDGRLCSVDLHQREDLRAEHHLPGPAIVVQEDTTTIIPPGFAARVDGLGNLVITGEDGRHVD
jgi:N-methylhydantoinase A